MNPDEPSRPDRSGLSLAVALLVGGALVGFGLRSVVRPADAAEQDAWDDAPTFVHRQTSASSDRQGSGGDSRPRPARPDGVTLSEEQISMVLADPGQFSLRLADIRSDQRPTPLVLRHAELFGWDEILTDQVDEALENLVARWSDLERAKADVEYPEPGRVVVTFGAMAVNLERISNELHSDLAAIVGHRNAAQFAAVANSPSVFAERGPDTREELTIAKENFRFIGSVRLYQDEGGDLHQTTSFVAPTGAKPDSTPRFGSPASPAIDWERVWSEMESLAPVEE